MADLTPMQEEFVLTVVLPEVNRQNGAGEDSGCSAEPTSDGTLREKVLRRREQQ